MKLSTSYNTVTIETSLTKKELETAQAYAKGADTLLDAEKNPTFKINYGKTGSVNAYGITFNAKTADGNMFHSFTDDKLPETPVDRKAYLQEKFGSILFSLNAVESQIRTALSNRAGEIAAVADSIVVG